MKDVAIYIASIFKASVQPTTVSAQEPLLANEIKLIAGAPDVLNEPPPT